MPRRDTNKYTTVQMIGGLGNNLFQLAAGLTVQQQFGGELRFFNRDIATQDLVQNLTGQFVHHGTRGIGREVSMGENRGLVHRARRGAARRLRLASGELEWRFVRNSFAPFPLDLAEAMSHRSQLQSIFLWGFFQHPSWYESSLQSVTERIWETLEPSARAVLDSQATVISVRRGDYVPLGWDLQMHYYERALEALGPVDGPIWVVSDDPTIDSEFLPLLSEFGLTAEPIPDLGIGKVLRDLVLLTVARSVIMSNSSFCWWGVVTGQLQGEQGLKRILAPSRWLPREGSDVLLRPDWQQIEHDRFPRLQASA